MNVAERVPDLNKAEGRRAEEGIAPSGKITLDHVK